MSSHESWQNRFSSDHLRKGQDVPGAMAVIAGSVSGLLARTVTAPLDTVKIRHQLQLGHEKKYIKIISTFKTIVREEGVRALWKGNVPASMMYVLYGSLQFGSYAWLNKMSNEYYPNISPQINSVLVGGLAGMSSMMAIYPFDVLRTRFIANRNTRLVKMAEIVKNIQRTEGPIGFFRGYIWSTLTISLSAAVTFGTYETLNIYSETSGISWLGSSSSTVAGLLSKTITFPLDTVRRRIQIIYSQDISSYTADPGAYKIYRDSNFLSIALRMARHEGISSLYKGLSMALCKSTPTTMISLWVFEHAIDIMQHQKQDQTLM
ncbi:thiamine transporter TPC1 Ecym_1248 [Eremothecium cymbalariae DBVPG|uniref:Mitochondrial thiamine pyrophosphate carrier 1 n=1 Tax=Eremothecium cymbalariae (strain CBS 270.75 / DBVPG 7215 / KCTC 17166 / NRRL Y-17582) TaxID=931890 RepID=G8JN27_ERECY|nr:hypothetical protein Ecym_1248 [Eremothecium cymbalariae DBVPG\